MKKKIELLSSGISLVDSAWGGLYRGGTYLLIGAHKSGRTLLSLQYALECVKQNETCLFFTNMRPKDLMIQAASIDFDLQSYMNQNLIIVVRVAKPSDMTNNGNQDEFLVEYLNDIVTVVDQYQPGKIVFDELTPFIEFENVNKLKDTFQNTLEVIEDNGITSLFVMGDPVTAPAREIVDTLAGSSTGIIYLQKDNNDGLQQKGKIIITPNVGHTEGKFSAYYSIEPYKGIVTDIEEQKAVDVTPVQHDKFIPLQNIEKSETAPHYSNIYDKNEFGLILNNQIALYNSTGQSFSLAAFKLNLFATSEELLTINQLKNAIRLSTNMKDKICVIDNIIIVLLNKDDEETIRNFVSSILYNLPSDEDSFILKVQKYISVFVVNMDSRIRNADDVFDIIVKDELKAAGIKE